MIFGAPEFLSGLFRTIAIMSIIGSIVILLLLLIKPIVRHRLPKSAQYYLWIVVLAVLLVPLSNVVVLPTDTPPGVNVIHNVVERNVISTDEAQSRQLMGMDANNALTQTVDPMRPNRIIVELPPELPPDVSPGLFAQVSTALMLLYPFVVLLILLFTVAGYIRFTAKVRRFNLEAEWVEKAILRDIAVSNNIKHTPRLYRNTFVTTPMLIGLFKPVIILPDKEYTEKQLHSILLHEVLHFKRLDIIIKWLSLLACAVHWFNPLVWIARREISRACELSCDEAVIHNMDSHAKQNYGETLICVAGDAKTPLTVLSTTMCEEKRELKERLAAIMESKKYTKFAVLASVIVILIVTLVACTLSMGTATDGGTGTTTDGRNDSIASNYHRTIQTYVDQYIDNWKQQLAVSVFPYGVDVNYFYVRPANIIYTRVNSLEKRAEFGNILAHPIELWWLDFTLRTNDLEDGYLRWGMFSPDADGWVGYHSAWLDPWTDPRTFLVFTRSGDEVEFLGSLPWWMEGTQHGLEGALHTFLEHQGIFILPDGANAGEGPAYITIRGQQICTSREGLTLENMDLTNEDIVPLRYMTNLTHLLLRNTGNVSDLTPIAGLTNLFELDLSANNISDLTPLAGLVNLERLSLSRNPVTDFSPLADLPNLKTLVAIESQIADISTLANLTGLTGLALHINQITELSPLAGLTNLEVLYLDANQINDISPLANLTNLEMLILSDNQIDDVTALSRLTNLSYLDLKRNQIRDISPLANLANLKHVFLNENQITDVTPLASLANLNALWLNDNPITDWSPLDHIHGVSGRP